MKKILILSLLTLFVSQQWAFAQGGLLLDNTQFVCYGSIKIVIENGKWKNTNSTTTMSSSTVKFTGNASAGNSTIEGSYTGFNNIEIAKSQHNVRLEADTTGINTNLIFTSKNIDLNGKAILLETSANLSGESETSRTYSALPLSRVTKTWATNNNPVNVHFGSMGLRFTATGNLGRTSVDRRHKVQTLPSGDGIQKYWHVTAANPLGQNVTLRFQYFDAELNGLDEGDLSIWRSVDGINWTDIGATANSTVSNYVEKTATIMDISGWWTLGTAPPFNGSGDERSAEKETPVSASAWSIFPNPVADFATVSIPSEKAESVGLELCDADGKVVLTMSKQLEIGDNLFLINLQALAPGIYFARVVGQSLRSISLLKMP